MCVCVCVCVVGGGGGGEGEENAENSALWSPSLDTPLDGVVK